MSIHLPDPPQAVTDVVRARLDTLLQSGALTQHAMIEHGDDSLAMTAPHAVYVLDLHAISNGQDLGAAAPVSWRYLVQQGEKVVASAEATYDSPTGDSPPGNNTVGAAAGVRFSHVSRGPRAAATATALIQAEQALSDEGPETEPRLLRIPSLQIEALWLHSEATDTITPLEPVPDYLAAGRPYTPSEFLDAIRPAVAVVLAAPPGSGG